MKATLVISERTEEVNGSIRSIVIWMVPTPVPPSIHNIKYRLAYVVEGVRVIGFDNERGKGDHRHLHGVETPYRFTTIAQLLADFRDLIELENRT